AAGTKGVRLGLPVQEQPFAKLCRRAGIMVGDLVFGWLPFGWGSVVGGLFGDVVGTFPQFFCGDGRVSAGFDNKANGSSACSKAKQESIDAKKKYDAAVAAGDQTATKPPDFNMNDCLKNVKKAKQLPNKAKDAGANKKFNTDGKTAKEMFFRAFNGD